MAEKEEKKPSLEEILNLPLEVVKAEILEPSSMILMGNPKIGKTTVCGLLPESIVLNFEDKTQTTTGRIKYVSSYAELKTICLFIQQNREKYNYRFGIIDLLSKLEELAVVEAEKLYMMTPQGKNWIIKDPATNKLSPVCGKAKYRSILHLPNGSGYPYLTEAMKNIKALIEATFEKVIYLVHTKDKLLANETGVEINVSEINLIGKNKFVFAGEAQAIGVLHRSGKNLIVTFQPGEEVISGCKVNRLDGKSFTLSTKEDDVITTFWEEIYPSLKKKNK